MKATGQIVNERFDVNVTFTFADVERTACAVIYPNGDGTDEAHDFCPGDFEAGASPFESDEQRDQAEQAAIRAAYAVYHKAVDASLQEVEIDGHAG